MVEFRSEERRAFLERRPPGATLCPGKTSLPATPALYLGVTRLASVDLNRLQLPPNLRTANTSKANSNKANLANSNKANLANSNKANLANSNKANLANKAWNKYGWMEEHNSTETIPSGTPFLEVMFQIFK